jgi:hypothetical protein
MNHSSTSPDIQFIKIIVFKAIIRRGGGECFFNNLAGCPLSLHKLQPDPLGTIVKTVAFGHGTFEPPTASFLT